jgi:aminoglycoside 6'-N-acetyltransferase
MAPHASPRRGFEARGFRFVALTEDHLKVMSRWLSDHRLLEYYGGRDDPPTEETIRNEYILSAGRRTDMENFIVQRDIEPVGYLQFYLVHPRWMDAYGFNEDEAPSVFGMDLFVGAPDAWGKGTGAAVVAGAAEYLVGARGASRIFLDPYVWNARAIRAYEKAGFRKVRIIPRKELHEGSWQDAWLMEYRSSELQR